MVDSNLNQTRLDIWEHPIENRKGWIELFRIISHASRPPRDIAAASREQLNLLNAIPTMSRTPLINYARSWISFSGFDVYSF